MCVCGGGLDIIWSLRAFRIEQSCFKSLHHEDLHVTCICLTALSKCHRFHSEYTRNTTLCCHLSSILNHHSLVFITLQILPSILSTPYVKKSFLAESRMGFLKPITGLDSIEIVWTCFVSQCRLISKYSNRNILLNFCFAVLYIHFYWKISLQSL